MQEPKRCPECGAPDAMTWRLCIFRGHAPSPYKSWKEFLEKSTENGVFQHLVIKAMSPENIERLANGNP